MQDPNSILNPALWSLRDAFRAQGFDIKLVGGCVRDLMLGLTPKDVDLHTDATPDECVLIYQAEGVRFEETGLSHGTISVIFDHVAYEITSLRTDTETDGRHAVVSYTRDWHTDLLRRDFRFNAMSMSFEGDILDPFGGQADLAAGVVRFVGDAETRIKEDYLRILRWFRFRGRFGMHMDAAAEHAVRTHAHGLEQISRERIWSEVSKILSGDHAVQLMKDIHDLGVDKHVDMHHALECTSVCADDVNLAVHEQTRNPVTMLVAVCDHHAKQILKIWKASSAEIKLAEFLYSNLNNDPFRLMAVEDVSRDWAIELCVLNNALNDSHVSDGGFMKAVLEEWEVPVFPVTGRDLIEMGMIPGPRMGQMLKDLKHRWANQEYQISKQDLLQLVF
jgi:tRNA nucleotidyltransferase/poly(A) polymerase